MQSLSRHLTVQKILTLLNSGMLNRGEVLCITVAVDQSTVDGFHDELQLSAKKKKPYKRYIDESVESKNSIWIVD